MQSHHNLQQIFNVLWDRELLKRNSFGDLLFRCVLFHQSLGGSDYDDNIVNLSSDERLDYCDPTLYSLIQFIIVAVD